MEHFYQNVPRIIHLMKYKDDLFVRYERIDHDAEQGDVCVMKIALDGTSKDMICRVRDMNYPLIHRGYLYYYAIEYSVTEEESQESSMNDSIREDISFHRMNIEKRNPKAELVYYREGDHGCGQPQVYGNYMWLFVIGDQGKRYGSRIYNIETGEIFKFAGIPMNRHSNFIYNNNIFWYT